MMATPTIRRLAKVSSASLETITLGFAALTRSSAGLSLPFGSVGHVLFLWPRDGGRGSGRGSALPYSFSWLDKVMQPDRAVGHHQQ